MVAGVSGRADIVRMIVERAPNTAVDHVSADGVTALLMAAGYHHAPSIRLLAEAGANVNLAGQNAQHRQQRTAPLRFAVQEVSHDMPPRDADPDGARQVAAVRALLRLGAGALPPPPPT